MQELPLVQEGVVGVHQKGVVELVRQLGFEVLEAGEINDKAVTIKVTGLKPTGETAAVAMHKAAVAWMAPLAMAAGIAAEALATTER
jgi:hypothetical protein